MAILNGYVNLPEGISISQSIYDAFFWQYAGQLTCIFSHGLQKTLTHPDTVFSNDSAGPNVGTCTMWRTGWRCRGNFRVSMAHPIIHGGNPPKNRCIQIAGNRTDGRNTPKKSEVSIESIMIAGASPGVFVHTLS